MGMRAKWELSAGAFEQLLHTLSPDRDVAGRRYETIRAGLLLFFTRRVGASAEALVDETIDRVGRRIDQGEILLRPGAYFLAVARNVLREHLRTERQRQSLAHVATGEPQESPAIHVLQDEAHLERLPCLHKCLGALSASDRTLIERYYGVSGPDVASIREVRLALAQQMGITSGNLRVRAHRARQRLETCYRRCAAATLGRSDPGERDDVD